jgi:ABC-type lipoprotein release transport system permease subunit
LIASVRRRRRDLALLKTIGFSRRQIASVVAWQASVVAIVGAVIGIPAGIILGRGLWTLFAHEIYAVPSATVPGLQLILVAVAALVLANIVSVVPERLAARTPTAALLRVE